MCTAYTYKYTRIVFARRFVILLHGDCSCYRYRCCWSLGEGTAVSCIYYYVRLVEYTVKYAKTRNKRMYNSVKHRASLAFRILYHDCLSLYPAT